MVSHSTKKYSSPLVGLGLILFSCIIFLIIAELSLRAVYVMPQSLANYYPLQAAKLGKIIQVRQYEFETQHRYNPQGFRDKAISREKKTGFKRILFVGDSFTEGYGVREDSRFSNRLVEMLGSGYEGINVGQLATNPEHYFDNIAKFGIALRPDLIVMGIFLGNDFMGGRGLPEPGGYKVEQQLPLEESFSIRDVVKLKYVHTLWQQVREGKPLLMLKQDVESRGFWELYFNQPISKEFHARNLRLTSEQLDKVTRGFNRVIVQQIYEGKINTGIFGEAINNQLKIKQQEPYYSNDDYKREYAYIKEAYKITTEHGIRFLALIIPDINQVHPTELKEMLKRDFLLEELPSRLHQLEEFRSRLHIDFEKDHVPYIDATQALKRFGKTTYYLYDNHMNKLGHEIVSRVLFPEVGQMLANTIAK